MSKIKRIPFDAEKAKKGAKVVTRNGLPVRIGLYDVKGASFPISGAVTEDDTEVVRSFTKEGRHYAFNVDSDYDLFIEEEEEEKTRREYSGTDSIFVPNDDEGIIEELIDAINGLWDNDALPMPLSIKRKDAWITWLQKQGGEKTSDSLEISPDKWYVCIHAYKSEDVLFLINSTYSGKDILNYHLPKDKDYQDFFRPWTIQDAKPGDILINGSNVFVIHFIHDKIIVPYCHININDGKFYNDFRKHFCLCSVDDVITLATEEQCNLFIQKMKEAGYKWNYFKNELEKVEKEVKKRVMTYQEVAWWLRRNPEEFREWKFRDCDGVNTDLGYNESKAHQPAKYILIRKNGGEWQEPLIEE